jgi:lysine-specific demethylase 8
VPIELGASYTSEGWAQRMMTMREFIEGHVLAAAAAAPPVAATVAAPAAGAGASEGGAEGADAGAPAAPAAAEDCGSRPAARAAAETGYLAQHRLFDQVPRLRGDVEVPAPVLEACAAEAAEAAAAAAASGADADTDVPASPPTLLAWLGPAGTLTPLHFDVARNVFCQVVGVKRVLLAAPRDAAGGGAGGLENTSDEDPERASAAEAEAGVAGGRGRFVEALLGPGDALYIPPGWWHHVRALTASASVSIWF